MSQSPRKQISEFIQLIRKGSPLSECLNKSQHQTEFIHSLLSTEIPQRGQLNFSQQNKATSPPTLQLEQYLFPISQGSQTYTRQYSCPSKSMIDQINLKKQTEKLLSPQCSSEKGKHTKKYLTPLSKQKRKDLKKGANFTFSLAKDQFINTQVYENNKDINQKSIMIETSNYVEGKNCIGHKQSSKGNSDASFEKNVSIFNNSAISGKFIGLRNNQIRNQFISKQEFEDNEVGKQNLSLTQRIIRAKNTFSSLKNQQKTLSENDQSGICLISSNKSTNPTKPTSKSDSFLHRNRPLKFIRTSRKHHTFSQNSSTQNTDNIQDTSKFSDEELRNSKESKNPSNSSKGKLLNYFNNVAIFKEQTETKQSDDDLKVSMVRSLRSRAESPFTFDNCINTKEIDRQRSVSSCATYQPSETTSKRIILRQRSSDQNETNENETKTQRVYENGKKLVITSNRFEGCSSSLSYSSLVSKLSESNRQTETQEKSSFQSSLLESPRIRPIYNKVENNFPNIIENRSTNHSQNLGKDKRLKQQLPLQHSEPINKSLKSEKRIIQKQLIKITPIEMSEGEDNLFSLNQNHLSTKSKSSRKLKQSFLPQTQTVPIGLATCSNS